MSIPDEKRITLLYDIKLNRPACPLLQALTRLDYLQVIGLFPPHSWIHVPTHDMYRIGGTVQQWKMLAARWL